MNDCGVISSLGHPEVSSIEQDCGLIFEIILLADAPDFPAVVSKLVRNRLEDCVKVCFLFMLVVSVVLDFVYIFRYKIWSII